MREKFFDTITQLGLKAGQQKIGEYIETVRNFEERYNNAIRNNKERVD